MNYEQSNRHTIRFPEDTRTGTGTERCSAGRGRKWLQWEFWERLLGSPAASGKSWDDWW
ncbi:hypothetical protein [Kamptonema formosum]|uniref:hypothetical protein n=1 Tax=Kamptonema formosum TaxID=331992 RepID=UPI00034717F6|nr:hypothetical protein [Oscillatoria sp. PCC 10802]